MPNTTPVVKKNIYGKYCPTGKQRDRIGLVGTKLNISQQWAFVAKKVNDVLGCIRRSIASQLGGDPAPLLRAGEDIPGVLCPVLCSLVH